MVSIQLVLSLFVHMHTLNIMPVQLSAPIADEASNSTHLTRVRLLCDISCFVQIPSALLLLLQVDLARMQPPQRRPAKPKHLRRAEAAAAMDAWVIWRLHKSIMRVLLFCWNCCCYAV